MTINEMLVVIIISSIVIGMAFTVLRMVQQHMWSIQNHMSKNTTLVRLEQSLWIDFNTYNKAVYNASEALLIFKSELDSVTYKLSETYITKTKDTFRLKLKNKNVFFNGHAISSGAIDAIELEYGNSKPSHTLFVYNRKEAKKYMD